MLVTDRGGAGSAHTELTTVLVVVPARDEQERLGRCLASVRRAADVLLESRPGTQFSVTVALDLCTDGTAHVAARAGAEVVVVDAGCVGVTRHAGALHAWAQAGRPDPAGVLLVNTDADCVVPPDWLVEHVGLADDHDLVLGEVEPEPTEMTPASLALWWARHPIGRGSLHGANLGVRLDSYLRAGGFPAIAHQEDLLLVRVLRTQGAEVVGGTRVVTSGRRTGRTPAGFSAYLRDMDVELESPA